MCIRDRCRVQSAECRVQSAECRVLSSVCCVLCAECWVVNAVAECWVLSAECWVLSAECWVQNTDLRVTELSTSSPLSFLSINMQNLVKNILRIIFGFKHFFIFRRRSIFGSKVPSSLPPSCLQVCRVTHKIWDSKDDLKLLDKTIVRLS